MQPSLFHRSSEVMVFLIPVDLKIVILFSSPELQDQAHNCDHSLSLDRLRKFHLFDISSETTEQNLMKIYWNQELNVHFQIWDLWDVCLK